MVADYTSLVRQVYIDPIRSVVVVDDDFPTLDGLLATANEEIRQSAPGVQVADALPVSASAAPAAHNADSLEMMLERPVTVSSQPMAAQPYMSMRFDGRRREVERARELIAACRRRDRPWLVDVHDGRPGSGADELAIAPSLHHSDLMILDYHLDGDFGSGDRAIKILQKLASNDQFNLVIVYTKGVDGDIREVFEQIATSLTYRDGVEFYDARLQAIAALIAEWEEEVEDYEVLNNLKDDVSTLTYLSERGEKGWILRSDLGDRLKSLAQRCPPGIKQKDREYDVDGKQSSVRLHAGTMCELAFAERHKERFDAMSETDLGIVQCAFGADANWIRMDRLFVTVVNKDHAPDALVEKLVSALNAWAPGPHQLLMGKMRAQLGEKGVIAEGDVLRDRHLQAGWFREMLDNDGDSERVMHHSINRHWEALGDRMHSDVKAFAKDLFDNFRAADRAAIEKRYVPNGIQLDEELAHLNHYYSTKPVDRSHLTTGQVLKIVPSDAENQPPEYWVCLSPACDLVPGQKTRGWRERLGQSMPFMAVQLGTTDLPSSLKRVNENRFVFVRTGDHISALTFVADSKSTSMPVWEQMFAAKNGRFVEGKCAIQILRTREVNGELAVDSCEAEVVCQLRYEYALNLLQRLGGSLSRIGLDFRSPPEEKKPKKSDAPPKAPVEPQIGAVQKSGEDPVPREEDSKLVADGESAA